MVSTAATSQLRHARGLVMGIALLVNAVATSVFAAGCAPTPQDEGHVAEIVDGRRLNDGREIRLTGIEPSGITKEERVEALAAILTGHDVILRGHDDTPDRYGRPTAFVFLAPSDRLVQAEFLSRGQALVAPDDRDQDCAAALMAAEVEARGPKREPGALTLS